MSDDILAPPPEHEEVVKVYHFPSPKWRGKVPAHLAFEMWEKAWFDRIQPSAPPLYINGNGAKASETPYARFTETMPNGKGARHTLPRYLSAMRARILCRLSLGPEPDKRGPPVGLIDGDACNLRPSNRKTLSFAAPRQASYERRKIGHDADWSARIRVDAVFAGRDPDEAFAEEAERVALAHAQATRASAREAAEAARKATERLTALKGRLVIQPTGGR